MPETIEIPVVHPEAMAWYELNDIGNARRILDLAQGKLLWCEDHWRAYDSKRWSGRDGTRIARQLAHDMARHIPIEADALDSMRAKPGADVASIEERQVALYKHAVQSGNLNKTTAALGQLQSEVPITRDDFDREALAVNVGNGTLRFVQQGGEWRVRLDRHDLADRISRLAAVDWIGDADDPMAACPEWDRHIATVLPDPAVRRFFQACMGYAITGEITEQCIFLLQGKGGDGKSTTIDVIREIMGEYGATAAVESFLHGAARSGAEASPDMARLGGDTRICCISEPRIGAALDEGRIKQVTGGQPIQARELHGAPFEYRPRFALIVECNRKPRISGDDDGIWRRIVVIQFPHQFKGEADKTIGRRLLAEGPGVLRWLVEGTLIWLREGLQPPQSVHEAIDDYRKSSNPFGEWFADRVDLRDPDHREKAADLYASYKAFCEENAVSDRETMSSTAFGRALGDKQLAKMKGSDGKVLRRGCRLRGDWELAQAAQAEPAPIDEAPGAGFDDLPENW